MSSVNLVTTSTIPVTTSIKVTEPNRLTVLFNGIFKNLCTPTTAKVILFSAVAITLVGDVVAKDSCDISLAGRYLCAKNIPWSLMHESCKCALSNAFKGWF